MLEKNDGHDNNNIKPRGISIGEMRVLTLALEYGLGGYCRVQSGEFDLVL